MRIVGVDTQDPSPTSEDLQNLVERFGRARWIADRNLVTPSDLALVFTPLGQQRMRQIFSVMENATNGIFPDEQNLRATDSGCAVIGQLADALAEIQPPRLSDSEWEMLKALAHGFAKHGSL